jgi:sensor domain CHASE-containing protein
MKNKINIVLVVLLTVMTSVIIILALYAYVQKSNIDDLKQDLNNIKRNRLQ